MDPREAIRAGQAKSEIISLGGRPTIRGALRFVTATGKDIPPWAAANVKDAIVGHRSNPVRTRV